MLPTHWLPPRARAVLSRAITLRNALDRALAVSKGVDPQDAACIRFQPGGADALDGVVRKRAATARAVQDGRAARNRGEV